MGEASTSTNRKLTVIAPSNAEVRESFLINAKGDLARAWAGFKYAGKDTAAEEVAVIGKQLYGDSEFEKAMVVAAEAAGTVAEGSVGMGMG